MAEFEATAVAENISAKLDADQIDEYSKYLLHSRPEIVAVLRSLVKKRAMLSVHFDNGDSFLLTTLLAVDAETEELFFDVGSDPEMNAKALLAEKLILATTVDRIRIQFTLHRLSTTTVDGHPALRALVPDSLLRLQRREYFRLSTPIANPIRCIATMTREDGSATVIEVPLLDISGCGVGLMVPPKQSDLYRPEQCLNDCKITLPDEGLLIANLRVRNSFDVIAKSGAHYVRVGCEFVELPGQRMTMIQRYITRVERERKARTGGLG